MPFRQSIDSARQERIGAHGVDAAALNEALARTAPALDWIRARHADGALPLLRLPERHDDIHAIRTAGARLASNASDIVILGTGGSSLGGQTLAQLADYAVEGAGSFRNGPRLHFMDNLDPDSYAALLKRLLNGGLLITVAGRPEGVTSTEGGAVVGASPSHPAKPPQQTPTGKEP